MEAALRWRSGDYRQEHHAGRRARHSDRRDARGLPVSVSERGDGDVDSVEDGAGGESKPPGGSRGGAGTSRCENRGGARRVAGDRGTAGGPICREPRPHGEYDTPGGAGCGRGAAGAVGAAGGGRSAARDRMRERQQPIAGARGSAAARDRGAGGFGRERRAAAAATADGELAAQPGERCGGVGGSGRGHARDSQAGSGTNPSCGRDRTGLAGICIPGGGKRGHRHRLRDPAGARGGEGGPTRFDEAIRARGDIRSGTVAARRTGGGGGRALLRAAGERGPVVAVLRAAAGDATGAGAGPRTDHAAEHQPEGLCGAGQLRALPGADGGTAERRTGSAIGGLHSIPAAGELGLDWLSHHPAAGWSRNVRSYGM